VAQWFDDVSSVEVFLDKNRESVTYTYIT